MVLKNKQKDKPQQCGFLTNLGTHCKARIKIGQERCHLHMAKMAKKGNKRKTNIFAGNDLKSNINNLQNSKFDGLAIINHTIDNDKFKLLRETLNLAGFWDKIEAIRKSCKISLKNFQVIIKPNFEFFDFGAPTGTDPEIVEHLVLILHRKGYRNVAIADSIGSTDLWLENRDVSILADLIGCRFSTDDGVPYDIINLSEDLIKVNFPKDGVLNGTKLAKRWVNAHFRINIAKNKTHEENSFSLCLQNLLGVLPLRDKEYHYHHRFKPWDVCIDLLKLTPIHFNIIDAFVSNHGSNGTQFSNPLPTKTIIASNNLLLADWAAALKMGIDPYASPLNAKVLQAIGLPTKYKIKGNLTPYSGWKNVHPILSDSISKRNRSVTVNRKALHWFQSVNRELFPFKNEIDDKINFFLTKYLSNTDDHFWRLLVKVLCNYFLANSYNFIESWQILYNKDKLSQKPVALGFNIEDYDLSDYESLVDYMQPLSQIAAQTPPDSNGLRWRYIDNSVLFEFSRNLPIKYEKFISRVKISNAVNMMNDYIGGACVPVLFDRHGRVTHQAERNIYLPQPNWMVVFGGTVIDVGKIELIHYKNNCQQIFWRTVSSINNSASFDDGIVTFAKDEYGKTAITIVARQKFSLPLLWQFINLDLIPEIKNVLVSNSYTTFFSRTIANFEAAFEGRTIISGQPWKQTFGEPCNDSEKASTKNMSEIIAKISGLIESMISNTKGNQQNSFIDENGFRHFPGNASGKNGEKEGKFDKDAVNDTIRSFFTDVFSAVKKDLGIMDGTNYEDKT